MLPRDADQNKIIQNNPDLCVCQNEVAEKARQTDNDWLKLLNPEVKSNQQNSSIYLLKGDIMQNSFL